MYCHSRYRFLLPQDFSCIRIQFWAFVHTLVHGQGWLMQCAVKLSGAGQKSPLELTKNCNMGYTSLGICLGLLLWIPWGEGESGCSFSKKQICLLMAVTMIVWWVRAVFAWTTLANLSPFITALERKAEVCAKKKKKSEKVVLWSSHKQCLAQFPPDSLNSLTSLLDWDMYGQM